MDLRDILLIVHFIGLLTTGAAILTMPVLVATARGTLDEHRATIGKATKSVVMIGRIGLTLLLVTGVIMATINGYWSIGGWFYVKLGLIVLLAVTTSVADSGAEKVGAGDSAKADQAKMFGYVNILVVAFIILSAVMTFH